MKAVIPAAGSGKRFHPWTFGNAKELVPVLDPKNPKNVVAVLDLVVREAYEAGCKDICVVTALGKYSIENHLQTQKIQGNIPKDVNLFYVHQDEPKGLGHAILCAEKFVGKEDFAVLLGDDFYENNPTKQMMGNGYRRFAINQSTMRKQHTTGKFGGLLTIQEVPTELLSRYGVVEFLDGYEWRIKDVVEKPRTNPPSNYVVAGRYILTSDIFYYIRTANPDSRGEIQLTDAIRAMIKDGYDMFGVKIEGKRYDAGEPAGWMEIIKGFADKLK